MAGPPLRLYTQEGISGRGNGKDRSRGGLSVASALGTEDGEESQRRGLKAGWQGPDYRAGKEPGFSWARGRSSGRAEQLWLALGWSEPRPNPENVHLAQACAHGDLGNPVFSNEYVSNEQSLFNSSESSLGRTALVKRILNDQLLFPTRPGPSLWSSTADGGRGLGTNGQTYGLAARRPDPRSQREIQAEPRLPLLMATCHPPACSPLLAADPGAGDGHRFRRGLPR